MSLEDELRKLPEFEGGLVRLDDVLKVTEDAWLVELKEEMHSLDGSGVPDEVTGRVWAVLDTCYALMRHYAPTIMLDAIRKDLPEGYDFPDNDKLIIEVAANGGPATLAESVGPVGNTAALYLATAFSEIQGTSINNLTEYSPTLQAAEPVVNEKYEQEAAEADDLGDLLAQLHDEDAEEA